MSFLSFKPESSSVIKLLVYGLQERILAVQFHSNTVWLYYDLDLEIFDELVSAQSVGQYFNLHIRNRYTSEKYISATDYDNQLGFFFEKEE